MNNENPQEARPGRRWLQQPDVAEPVFYVGTIGMICLYMWLMMIFVFG